MKLTPEQLHGVCLELELPLLQAQVEKLHAAIVAREKKPAGVHEFIKAYADAFKARYGVMVPINGRAAGVAKRVVADLGQEKAILFIERFLEMSDAFFVQRRHDLLTFENNLNAVATGVTVTRKQIEQAESKSHAQSQLARIREGTL